MMDYAKLAGRRFQNQTPISATHLLGGGHRNQLEFFRADAMQR
jgi:hypothetical protein